MCPKALFNIFSNPLTVNVRAVPKTTSVKVAGLCYVVTWYQHYLAKFIWVPFKETMCWAIGVNHYSWITEFQYNGKDAWSLVHAKMAEKPEESNKTHIPGSCFVCSMPIHV